MPSWINEKDCSKDILFLTSYNHYSMNNCRLNSLKTLCLLIIRENIYRYQINIEKNIKNLPTFEIEKFLLPILPLGFVIQELDYFEKRNINLNDFWKRHFIRVKNFLPLFNNFPLYLIELDSMDILSFYSKQLKDLRNNYKQLLIDFIVKWYMAHENEVFYKKFFEKTFLISDYSSGKKLECMKTYINYLSKSFDKEKFLKNSIKRCKTLILYVNKKNYEWTMKLLFGIVENLKSIENIYIYIKIKKKDIKNYWTNIKEFLKNIENIIINNHSTINWFGLYIDVEQSINYLEEKFFNNYLSFIKLLVNENSDKIRNFMIFGEKQYNILYKYLLDKNLNINELAIYSNNENFLLNFVEKFLTNYKLNIQSLSLMKIGEGLELNFELFKKLLEKDLNSLRLLNFTFTSNKKLITNNNRVNGNIKNLYFCDINQGDQNEKLLSKLILNKNLNNIEYLNNGQNNDIPLSECNEYLYENLTTIVFIPIKQINYRIFENFRNLKILQISLINENFYYSFKPFLNILFKLKHLELFTLIIHSSSTYNIAIELLKHYFKNINNQSIQINDKLNLHIQEKYHSNIIRSQQLENIFQILDEKYTLKKLINDLYLFNCKYENNINDWNNIINKYSQISHPYFILQR